MRIIIITGYSGSGKSTAVAALEDAGFYCVDNMPVALLPKFLELPVESDWDINGLCFVMDLREKGFLTKYPGVFAALRQSGYPFEIIFLEADENTLQRRYSQTRRHHPLAQDGNLLEGIRLEKEQLKDLRRIADRVINTSDYNVHDLKSVILNIAPRSSSHADMKIHVLSFGFKYGLPHDADLVMDVRFLANPHFIPELEPMTGTDKKVSDFVLNSPETRRFLKKYMGLLEYLIPMYEKEGKAYLTVAVGCTGGRHRSVAISQYIFEHIRKMEKPVKITHRDLYQPAD